ncbi:MULTISPECIES: hypothetical protein [Moorena]|nr:MULTISPECIES: hypothetical protein [Moorena]NEQ14918.1 hypothetical protein [Moorena sp. SIO3E2]NEP30713.1 hypothetical protein [Moorena sp. SIO3B2]NEQ05853.1 hypothetical protein [Moorena sp. SIO4E2]NER91752.1 hypothetical protein [Moorena sp. SIO3A2]OLT65226.1 hypothetical protein BI334_09405 [Moorena producens 3L]
MSMQELSSTTQSHVVTTQWQHPVRMTMLIVLCSLVMGLVPFMSISNFAQTQTQTPITLGEAGLWETLGERN